MNEVPLCPQATSGRNLFCRKAMLPFGSHHAPPVQRIAAATVHGRLKGFLGTLNPKP
jgi:hypothetical protein